MFKFLLIFGIILVLCAIFPCVGCVAFNPHFTTFYGFKDIYKYFKYKEYNNAPYGKIDCYCALFGKGKTLSVVHELNKLYSKYNNKKIWDNANKKWKIQKINIISNVDMKIPYMPLTNLQEVVSTLEFTFDYNTNPDNPYYYVTYVLCDEASVQFNSRNFKANFSPAMLAKILTCRHYRSSWYMTAQRFNQIDALMRQNTQHVYEVNKCWRLMSTRVYDAYELENCTNPMLVKPLKRSCWFVRNKDYEAYDTFAVVSNLLHDAKEGMMLSDEQILTLQNANPDADTVTRTTRKARKRKFHK